MSAKRQRSIGHRNPRPESIAALADLTRKRAWLTIPEPQRIGQAIVVSAFVRDITRRRQALDAIEQSEALYHSLVDVLPIYFTRVDLGGRITFVNQPYCELVNMTSDELIGRTNHDIVSPEPADKFRRVDQHVAMTGEVFHAIEENDNEDHTECYEVWKVPVRNGAGQVVETQAVFSDVKEREENRAALAEKNERMKRDLEAAAELQKSILPTTLPAVDGVTFAWKYQPCDELAGDILGVFQLDENHVGCYIADVSGHGVAASLLSVAISRTLNPVSSDSSLVVKANGPSGIRIVPPSQVARELNVRFPMEQSGDKFFTLIDSVLDTTAREMRYVSAGHSPMIRSSEGQEPEPLDADAMMIGVVAILKSTEPTCIPVIASTVILTAG